MDALEEFAERYGGQSAPVAPSDVYGQTVERLRSILLVSGPKDAALDSSRVPALSEQGQSDWLSNRLYREWRTHSSSTGGDDTCARESIAAYVGLVASGVAKPPEVDTGLVDRVRAGLRRAGSRRDLLHPLIERYEELGFGLRLNQLVPTSTALVSRRNAYVRGAFTRRAWEHGIRAELYSQPAAGTGEAWVLGNPEAVESEAAQAEMRSRYFALFVSEWRSFLDRVSSSPAEGDEGALRLAQALTAGEPTPIEALIRSVRHQTTLSLPEEETSDAGDAVEEPQEVETVHPRDVEARFAGFIRFAGTDGQAGPLAAYLEQVRFVRDELRKRRESEGVVGALDERVDEARSVVRGLIEAQEVGWRPDFERLLWPFVESASENATFASAAAAGRGWCAEVHRPWSTDFASRYPFRASGEDLSMDAFESFFHPERGMLWRIYRDSLSSAFPRRGGGFEPRARAPSTYRPGLAAYLRRADAISRTFFPSSEGAGVHLDVRIHPSPSLTSIVLTVDGQQLTHENGPERWSRIRWPVEDARTRGAFLELTGVGGMRVNLRHRGDWGLLRLLSTGTVEETDRGSRVVSWSVPGSDARVRIEMRPTQPAPALFPRENGSAPGALLDRWQAAAPPAEIVTGRTTCARN